MSKHTPEQLLALFRPAVRAQKPYLVPGARPVSVKLNQNESPFDLPPALKRELLEAFFQIDFNRYPSEHPVRITPTPMFSLYESMVRLHGGTPIRVECTPTYQVDTDAIIDAVEHHQPPLTILTTPSNPTGLAIPKKDIERVVRAAEGFVVIDEAYNEFNPEGSALDLQMKYPNVIILRTLSKAFGLAGLRLGYLVARPEIIAEMMKSRLPFMVDRLAEQVGLLLLRHEDLVRDRVEQIKVYTEALHRELSAMDGVEVLPTNTNFILFRTGQDAADLLDKLANNDVLVRNMGGYEQLQGFLRVTSGTPSENKAFLDALTSALG